MLLHYFAGLVMAVGTLFIITGFAGWREYDNDARTLLFNGFGLFFAGLVIGVIV